MEPVLRHSAALLTIGALYLASVAWLRTSTRRPYGLLWAIGLAFAIAVESVLLNALSLLRLVTPLALLIGNLGLAGLLAWLAFRTQRLCFPREYTAAARSLIANQPLPGVLWVIVPLLVLLAATAIVFPPSTYDAMTYHLARVVHWLDNRSVGYYLTSNERQNVMGPGSEYLILILQAISGSDLWANSVQLFSWLVCLATVPHVCRLAGVPRRLTPFSAVFVAGLPMGVMQATSTQTDMVASALTLATIAASIPFLRSDARWRLADGALLGAALGAAWLVKPTSVIVASPLLLAAGVYRAIALRREIRLRQAVYAVAVGLAVLAVVAGPDLVRKTASTGSVVANRAEVFPLVGEWQDRFSNVASSLARHSPRDGIRSATAYDVKERWPVTPFSDQFWIDTPARIQEDAVANPLQLTLAVVLLLPSIFLAVLRVPRRVLVLSCLPYVSWVVFHLVVRDQPWITRLQTPIFVLSPLSWGVFSSMRFRWSGLRTGALALASVISISYGYFFATHMEGKSIYLPAVASIDRTLGYYYLVGGPWFKDGDDAVLTILSTIGCDRLGLNLGSDTYEYPLVWRARQSGVVAKHYRSEGLNPCAIYSNKGDDLGPVTGAGWLDVGGGVTIPVADLSASLSATVTFPPVPPGNPYSEVSFAVPGPLAPGDIVVVDVRPGGRIDAASKPEALLLDWSDWRHTIVVSGILATPNSTGYQISRIVTVPLPQPTLVWRNWSQQGPLLPETTLNITVYQLAHPAAR